MSAMAPLPFAPKEHMPYREKSMIGYFILVVRWPVMIGQVCATILQFAAAFAPIIKPEQLNLPDLVPPLNTAILALLWWRISQLEKNSREDRKYFQDRIDKLADHTDARDDRDNHPRMRRDR